MFQDNASVGQKHPRTDNQTNPVSSPPGTHGRPDAAYDRHPCLTAAARDGLCGPRRTAHGRILYGIPAPGLPGRHPDSQDARPYREDLAAQTGVHAATADRAVKELEAAGLVTVVRRHQQLGQDRAGMPSFHTLHDPDPPVPKPSDLDAWNSHPSTRRSQR